MMALVLDGIFDPLVGYASDHLHSRWGRRHPFMYAAALPVADEQVLTEVHLDPEGDVLYPAFEPAEWHESERVPGAEYDRVRWVRRRDY
jgi:hypothetical protein